MIKWPWVRRSRFERMQNRLRQQAEDSQYQSDLDAIRAALYKRRYEQLKAESQKPANPPKDGGE